MSKFILAIDQGTTNTKALLVDESGQIIARASRPVSISYPHPGWVEQDPVALWQSVEGAIDECLSSGPNLAAVAVSNQRETTVAWDKSTGQPIGPAVVWQCRRTAPFCEELRKRGVSDILVERTGLEIDPMFSGTKARWLLDEANRRDGVCVGTVDSWLLWNLTGGAVHACDMTNASRTQLFNLKQLAWDSELCDVLGVPPAALPQALPSSALFGETVSKGRLPAGIPIASLIGDSHAAYFGHAVFQPGAIKATYGTGSSLMTSVEGFVRSSHGLSSTIAWALKDEVRYALEGNIYATGAAVQWCGELLGLDAAAVAELAASVADSAGVYLVPAFVGLGAPHWESEARGLVTGLTRGVTRAELARAAVESIAFQILDVFQAMEADAGFQLPALLADGGASRNDTLMQFQADMLGRPVLRSGSADLSALGAAYLAGLKVGTWQDLREIEELPRERVRFEPRMSAAEREVRIAGWRKAIARTL